MNSERIEETVRSVAEQYPDVLREEQIKDIRRISYHIELLVDRVGTKAAVCDIGGGVGLFSVACAALGLRSFLVDDFNDDINRVLGGTALDLHKKFGVTVIARNVVVEKLGFEAEAFDAFTSFDSMEHWHHSPRRLFHELVRCLKPDGVFLLGVPNCVNARKRITVPFGIGSWSSMKHWYDEPEFRGHVREPNVSDLRYIAKDLNLLSVEIIGRNWLGYRSPSKVIKAITPFVDWPLQLFPSLCADIYVIGRKQTTPV